MQSRVEETIADDLDVVLLVAQRARADRRRRPLRRAARLRPRRAGRDRAQQGRPAQAGPHRRADEDRRRARRLPRAASGQRQDRRRDRRAPRRSRRAASRGPAATTRAGEVTDMPLEARIAELVREQALAADAGGGAARAHRRGDRDRRTGASTSALYTETESQKQILIGKGGSMVREIGRGAPGSRRSARSTSSSGQGLAEVAARRDDARALGSSCRVKVARADTSGAATPTPSSSAQLGARVPLQLR